jgi:hypothetical protein
MSANARTRGRGIGAVILSALLALMALVPLAATAGAQDASPAADATPVAAELGLELPEIEIRAQEFTYSITVPAPVAAGQYLVRFVNQTDVVADANIVLLPEDQTSGDLSGALFTAFTEEADGEFPDFFADATFVGGSWAEAQGTNEVVLNLNPGRYYVFTSLPGGAQSVQAFTVVTAEEAAGEPAPVATPGASPVASPVAEELPSDVQVSASEFAFDGADSASSGPQLWQVTNDGEALHNAVLVSGDVEADVSAGGSAVNDAMADADIAGAVGILSPGQVAYMVLDLESDSYTLVDTLPDGEGGDPNAAQGMVAVVEVE